MKVWVKTSLITGAIFSVVFSIVVGMFCGLGWLSHRIDKRSGTISVLTTKPEPPPGWGLQRSNDGKWRWVKEDGFASSLEWLHFDTRQQAIDDAWSFYEHQKKERERVWEDEQAETN